MLTLVFDARGDGGGDPLIPRNGPFATAMRGLTGRAPTAAVPDRVLLELYAYEIVERLRDLACRGVETGAYSLPFWPDAALAAADVDAHAARELRTMWPQPLRLVRRAVGSALVARRQQELFGMPLFDPATYARLVLVDEPHVVGQRVVGALLRRGDEVLLERRAATASAYAGLWDSPGGKVDPGEDPAAALRRECHEELGIEVEQFDLVALAAEPDPVSGAPFVHHVFRIDRWRGELEPREGQHLEWQPLVPRLAAGGFSPLLRWVSGD